MKELGTTRWAGYIMAISGGLLWAIGGAVGQYLFETNTITTNWLIPIRLLIAGVIFLLLAKVGGEDVGSVWKARKDLPRLVLYAVFGVAASQYSFYACIEYANVAFSTVMCYTCTVFIMVWCIFREHRKPKFYETVSVLCVVVGVFACATHFDLSCLSVSTFALVMGLTCGVTSSINTLSPADLITRHSLLSVMGWGMLIGGGVATLLFRPWTVQVRVDGALILGMAVIILGGTILAFTFYMRGIRLVGPIAGNVLSATEPVGAVVISVLVLGVAFTAYDFLGFLLILITVPLIAV
ncbi:MAG: EamA family transporter, partial [Ruminiclostridium sp.]|nr:EamA family transporter [Ruminiclostridium sp.]